MAFWEVCFETGSGTLVLDRTGPTCDYTCRRFLPLAVLGTDMPCCGENRGRGGSVGRATEQQRFIPPEPQSIISWLILSVTYLCLFLPTVFISCVYGTAAAAQHELFRVCNMLARLKRALLPHRAATRCAAWHLLPHLAGFTRGCPFAAAVTAAHCCAAHARWLLRIAFLYARLCFLPCRRANASRWMRRTYCLPRRLRAFGCFGRMSGWRTYLAFSVILYRYLSRLLAALFCTAERRTRRLPRHRTAPVLPFAYARHATAHFLGRTAASYCAAAQNATPYTHFHACRDARPAIPAAPPSVYYLPLWRARAATAAADKTKRRAALLQRARIPPRARTHAPARAACVSGAFAFTRTPLYAAPCPFYLLRTHCLGSSRRTHTPALLPAVTCLYAGLPPPFCIHYSLPLPCYIAVSTHTPYLPHLPAAAQTHFIHHLLYRILPCLHGLCRTRTARAHVCIYLLSMYLPLLRFGVILWDSWLGRTGWDD